MKKLIPVILLVVIGGAYAAYHWYVARQPYEWSGTVEARSITIGSRAGGRVLAVDVEEGQDVAAGKVLVTLEPGDLPAQRAIAAAQLAQAQAAYDKLVKGARPEELAQAKARAQQANAALDEAKAGARGEEIAASEARLAAADAALTKAKADGGRTHELFTKGAVAQADVDAADAALRSAQAERDAQARALDELKNGVRVEEQQQAAARAAEANAGASLVAAGAREEDLRAGKAAVDAAQGRVDQLDVLIGELEIKAPVAARIESLDLRPGDLLAPNAPAATLLEAGQLYVRIYVPETLIGRIALQQKVGVHVDSFPGKSFAGVVSHIDTVGQFSPRNLQTADERADQVFGARIDLVDTEGLRAGMAAFIQVRK